MSKFLTSFPEKVWFKSEDGWASRPATKADTKRRTLLMFGAYMRIQAKNQV